LLKENITIEIYHLMSV